MAPDRGFGSMVPLSAKPARLGDCSANDVLTLPTDEAIVRAVELGIGLARLSHLVVADAVAVGRVVRVPLRGVSLVRTLRIVRLRRRTRAPAALAFAAVARAAGTRE